MIEIRKKGWAVDLNRGKTLCLCASVVNNGLAQWDSKASEWLKRYCPKCFCNCGIVS